MYVISTRAPTITATLLLMLTPEVFFLLISKYFHFFNKIISFARDFTISYYFTEFAL